MIKKVRGAKGYTIFLREYPASGGGILRGFGTYESELYAKQKAAELRKEFALEYFRLQNATYLTNEEVMIRLLAMRSGCMRLYFALKELMNPAAPNVGIYHPNSLMKKAGISHATYRNYMKLLKKEGILYYRKMNGRHWVYFPELPHKLKTHYGNND